MADSIEEPCYWAITGRIYGDDEDSPYIDGPCTEGEAIANFRIHMREVEELPTLDGEADHDIDASGVTVFVISMFKSTAPILHG